MAIRFSIGNSVVVASDYIINVLPGILSVGNQGALTILGALANSSSICSVTALGNLGTNSFLTVLSGDVSSFFYNDGAGVVILLDNDTQINNAFSLTSRAHNINTNTSITLEAPIDPDNDGIITVLADCSNNDVTFTLPLSSICPGFCFRVVKTDTGAGALNVHAIVGDTLQSAPGAVSYGDNSSQTYYTIQSTSDGGWRQVSGRPIAQVGPQLQ